ncbi:MAG TPA: hypothetical protein DCS97_10885 [Planctomycetes bacterium]|nr:hypothetical protein [Planctomycetota bacterium]
MPTGTYPGLLDIANLTMPDGSLATAKQIVESLNQTSELWQEAVVFEGNDGAGHKSITRTGLPTNTWRKLYGGVPESKARTAMVRDASGMLENYATIDVKHAQLGGDSADWRFTQEAAFREAFNQDIAEAFMYGDTDVNPERFHGIVPRFNTTASGDNAQNIIKAGGVGADNASIVLTVWGPMTTHFFYPKGSSGGLQVKDLYEQTVYDASGDPFQAYRTHYKWDLGMAMPDWRYTARACNIDVSDLTKNAATGADIIDLMAQMIELLPVDFRAMGTPAFYVPKVLRSFLRRQIGNKSNVWLSQGEVGGKTVTKFDEIPVRRLDRMRITESLVP